MASLEEALVAIVGADNVITDDRRHSYETDWTGRYAGTARVVVRPGSTGEVAAVITACRDDGAAVTLQGGNTGLVGGSVPAGGEVLMSLQRLDDVRLDSATMVAEAGATLERVRAMASAMGARFPLDLASRGSATIGGMIATNAQGAFGARYGPMGDQVMGVRAVTGAGLEVDELDGGGATTTDVVGAEGVLAVVAAARLHLVEPKGASATALIGVEDAAEARDRIAAVDAVEAAELTTHEALVASAEHLGVSVPVGEAPAYLLVEVAGWAEELAPVVAGAGDNRVAVGLGEDRRRLWALRESHTEAVSRLGVRHKIDVLVPGERIDAFMAEVVSRVDSVHPGSSVFIYGHLLHDDLHVNVLGPDPADRRVDDAVLDVAVANGGSARGEHGWGRAKVDWMDDAERSRWRALKARYDPDSLLNPGVLLSEG